MSLDIGVEWMEMVSSTRFFQYDLKSHPTETTNNHFKCGCFGFLDEHHPKMSICFLQIKGFCRYVFSRLRISPKFSDSKIQII